MTFHVLYNREGGPVEEIEIEASSFAECESLLQVSRPDAEYWEIGADVQ